MSAHPKTSTTRALLGALLALALYATVHASTASAATQPRGAISGLSCHRRSCTLAISAHDPSSAALTVQGTAIYKVTTKCPVKRGQKPKKRRQPVCQKVVNAVVSAVPVSSSAGVTTYRATFAGLPYGQLVVLRAVITNAADLRPTSAPVRAVTLHPAAKPAHRPGRRAAKHGDRER